MLDRSAAKLLFVYNANSGFTNALLDYGKKYLSPSTYKCQLCMVSYGAFGMKKDWKRFIAELPYRSKFLHKDEFEASFQDIKTEYPAVYLQHSDGTLQPIITTAEFATISNLDILKSTLLENLKQQKVDN